MKRTRPQRALALLALLAVLAASGGRPAFAWHPSHPCPRTASGGLEGIPRFSHVVVLVLENESFATTWGSGSAATYLNGLRSQGVLADHYYATGHNSLDNYIAMVSGQPVQPATAADCQGLNLWTCVQGQSLMAGGRNLADQIEDAGLGWKGYMDAMPGPCFHADYSPAAAPPDPYQGHSTAPPAFNYADRHNPFLYFADVVGDDGRCRAHVEPYSSLAADLAADSLPAFSFIAPDTCHDGHDNPCADGSAGGLARADSWLSQNVPALLDYLRSHDGLLLITFDEASGTDTSGCCTGGPGGGPGAGGRVGLLALSAAVAGGGVVSTPYDHASLLRTIEDSLGIAEHLNNAGTAAPMADLFTPAPCVPGAASLCLGDGRFAVTASYLTRSGQAGAAQAVPLTSDTGYFWFFAAGNVEAVVKVLDGCGLDGSYWVFAGGLTDVQVTMTVTDTRTGLAKTYTNPQGNPFQPIQDTGALPVCP
ncbi:MAG TPA: alkaline phosphatase family protein [Thermoanaerobaculia bacterium]|nr:alkaline phosphatase family protein [Thermoanaerobaculia bacterium]